MFFLVGLGYNKDRRADLTDEFFSNANVAINLCKNPLKLKFEDVLQLYPRKGLLNNEEFTFLDMAMYNRSDVNNFQNITVSMNFENCIYNQFSEQFSKVIHIKNYKYKYIYYNYLLFTFRIQSFQTC